MNQTFDLFDKLGATEEQLDFPVVYASALQGWATRKHRTRRRENLKPLFEAILKHVPMRDENPDEPLQLQICSLDYSSYVGKIGIGRIRRGRIKAGAGSACVLNGRMRTPIKAKINQVLMFEGLAAHAGGRRRGGRHRAHQRHRRGRRRHHAVPTWSTRTRCRCSRWTSRR